MSVALLVKKAREEKGYSQGFLSSSVGIAQSTWSKYESEKVPMPSDIANRAIKLLESHRIRAEYNFEEKLEFFNVPVLNNVDDNSVVVLDSLLEEAQELIDNCQDLKKLIKNKRSREDLSDLDFERIMECEEQIADIYPALKLHFLKMTEQFGLDLELLEKRIQIKLKSKKYIK